MINQIKVMLGQMNPEQVVRKMVGDNNPMINNLIQMGKQGNTKGVETFARNILREQGRDFDKEFSDFKQMFK